MKTHETIDFGRLLCEGRASLGLSVAKPWGDSDRYDLVVDSGRRLWRVQVKSTRYVGERRFSITARGCTAAYTEDEIDFLAVYIVPLDFWYVIPVIIRFLRPGSVCGSIPRTRVRSGEIRNIGKRGG